MCFEMIESKIFEYFSTIFFICLRNNQFFIVINKLELYNILKKPLLVLKICQIIHKKYIASIVLEISQLPNEFIAAH